VRVPGQRVTALLVPPARSEHSLAPMHLLLSCLESASVTPAHEPCQQPGWFLQLAAKRGLQVPNVFLGLLEQRAQGFSHVGQPEVHGFAEPLSVTLELAVLELQVGG
jgi:hypothetical protein